MLIPILMALLTFLVTNIDDFILVMVFDCSQQEKNSKKIWLAQLIALSLIISLSLLGMLLMSFLPPNILTYLRWIGLIPITMGAYHLTITLLGIRKKHRLKKEQAIQTINADQSKELSLFSMTNMIFLSGADNIGVYIPIFLAMSTTALITTIPIFLILTCVICYLAILISKNERLSKVLKLSEVILVPILLIVIGLMIVFEVM